MWQHQKNARFSGGFGICDACFTEIGIVKNILEGVLAIKTDNQVYQIRINLKKISPMIWRRILIQSAKTLADLHYVIQITMGWTDYHLNEFKIHGKFYTIGNSGGMSSPNGNNGRDIKLSALKFRLNQRFSYDYDFTAGWEFALRLERILPMNEKKTYPACISGSGASPDEECGGAYYFNMLKDEWFYKSFEIMEDMLEVVLDKDNDGKTIREKLDRRKLREALYWLDIAKYDKKKADKYLKLYADGDERWRDAFAEVIYL